MYIYIYVKGYVWRLSDGQHMIAAVACGRAELEEYQLGRIPARPEVWCATKCRATCVQNLQQLGDFGRRNVESCCNALYM